jgi:hypothetical protein
LKTKSHEEGISAGDKLEARGKGNGGWNAADKGAEGAQKSGVTGAT